MLLAFTTLAHMTYDERSEVLPLMKGIATRRLPNCWAMPDAASQLVTTSAGPTQH
jgi:hypothetical protein